MFHMTNDQDQKSTRNRYIPEIIEGDMDSIRPEVKLFYSSQLSVLVTGALGGRFDHEAANINVLYVFSDMRIVLLSDDCLIRLLPKTHRHDLYIESSVEGPYCGLFPVGAPSTSTTTTGLKWNLCDSKMRFGSMISTSNIVKAEKDLENVSSSNREPISSDLRSQSSKRSQLSTLTSLRPKVKSLLLFHQFHGWCNLRKSVPSIGSPARRHSCCVASSRFTCRIG